MSSPPTPQATMSACFRPDDYKDLGLFADREELTSYLSDVLASLVDPQGPGQGHVLVRGDRGVGKSLLSRKAIDEVINELGPLFVAIDGAKLYGEDALVRRLARELSAQVKLNATNSALIETAELLRQLCDKQKVTTQEVRSWSGSLSANIKLGGKLSEFLGVEFGIGGSLARPGSQSETTERLVDAAFLQDMIQALLSACAECELHTILLIDNLDQVGGGEREDDLRLVTAIAKRFLAFESCVIVLNIRSEFVSPELARHQTLTVEVPGMGAAELMIVFDARVAAGGERARDRVARGKLRALAEKLAARTDNAWAFLTWLAFLDYQPLPEPLTDADLDRLMQRYVGGANTNMTWAELQRIALAFQRADERFIDRDELLRAPAVSIQLIERAVAYRVLVQEWVARDERYALSPNLHFLAPRPTS